MTFSPVTGVLVDMIPATVAAHAVSRISPNRRRAVMARKRRAAPKKRVVKRALKRKAVQHTNGYHKK